MFIIIGKYMHLEGRVTMSKLRNLVFILCCTVFSVMSNVEISVSGTVKDRKGTAIAGATVALVSDTLLKDITNASGEFTIRNSTAIHRGMAHGISMQNVFGICIKDNLPRFSISSPADNGVVSIFSGSGKRRIVQSLVKMEPGMHKSLQKQQARVLPLFTIIIRRWPRREPTDALTGPKISRGRFTICTAQRLQPVT